MSGSFASNRRKAEDTGEVPGKGDYLKLKDGDNKMRVCTHGQPHRSVFKGAPNFKWIFNVIDRKDGKVKPFFMAHTIYKAIEALQDSEEYGFKDVPMPYDINVRAKGAGTKEVEYTVIPARKEAPLTAGELDDLSRQQTPRALHEKLKEKDAQQQLSAGQATGEVGDDDGDVTADDVPF